MEGLTVLFFAVMQMIAGIWLLWFVFSPGAKQERPKPKILRYCPHCKKYHGAD